jgi:hypothetical protein
MEENNVVNCGGNIQIVLWIQLAGYYVHMVKITTDQAGRRSLQVQKLNHQPCGKLIRKNIPINHLSNLVLYYMCGSTLQFGYLSSDTHLSWRSNILFIRKHICISFSSMVLPTWAQENMKLWQSSTLLRVRPQEVRSWAQVISLMSTENVMPPD